MAARGKGDLSIRQIHRDLSWDDVNGWTLVLKYRGTWLDIQLAAETDAYVQGAARVNASQNGDQAQDGVLTVTFAAKSQSEAISSDPEVNEFSNTWTLAPAEEEVDVWKHEKFRGLSRISGQKGYLQRLVIDVQEYRNRLASNISTNHATDKDENYTRRVTPQGTDAQKALADQLADILLEGQDTEPIDRYALRNVRVVPGNTDITASHFKTRHMWSNDRMVSLIASGATQSSLIGDISSTFFDTYWYKLAPTIDERTNGRYEIVTEFVNFKAEEFNETLRPIYD